MRDPVFPTLCAIAIVLCLLPLPWHLRTRNIGTLLYIGWSLVGCIIYFINSLVWAGSIEDKAPIWCDISSKLIIGMNVGITTASLCINRRLFKISRISQSSMTMTRSDILVDLFIGIGIPIIEMAVHFIVQDHRFDILEDYGCWPVVYHTLPSIFLVQLWPICISIASFIYAGLTIRAFLRIRLQFAETIHKNSGGSLNTSRFIRLMALSATEMLFSLPLSIYVLVMSLNVTEWWPWVSWDDTHYNWYMIGRYSFQYINASPTFRASVDFSRWASVVGAFIFFAYFGMAGEASAVYKNIFWKAVKPFGLAPRPLNPVGSTWSNKLASNISSTRDVVSFPSSRPTYDPTRSTASAKTDDKFELSDTKNPHDLESQTSRL
ncbi:STE3-type pheromone receptor [Ceratobasidium sp. AG-Ba]|nr:STE3-type pheromone receptor [Ceratobasidium sp. AG-Ba]